MNRNVALVAAVAVAAIILCVVAVCHGGGDEGDREEWYRGYDAEYLYLTGGSTADDYASTLLSVRSDADVLFLQSALEGYPLRTIADGALSGCGSDLVVVPATVTSMSEGAMGDCRAELLFLGETPSGMQGVAADTVEVGDRESGMRFLVLEGSATLTSAWGDGDVSVPETVPYGEGVVPVTAIGCDSFRGSSFASVVIPASVERIQTRAFYGCDSLNSVDLGSAVSVEDEAFRHCSSMSDVDLEGVVFIGFEAFRDCHSFNRIEVPDSATYMGAGAFYICRNAESVTMGSGLDYIPDRGFGYCEELRSFESSGTVRTVGAYAFHMCRQLVSIDLSDVLRIGNQAFSECRLLASVELESVERIGSFAFSNCRSLTYVELPATLSSMGSEVFRGCRSLERVDFLGPSPNMEPDSLLGVECEIHVESEYADTWSGHDVTIG